MRYLEQTDRDDRNTRDDIRKRYMAAKCRDNSKDIVTVCDVMHALRSKNTTSGA